MHSAAAPHMRANTGQRLKPQLVEPADLRVIECRGRPRPRGVQMRAGAGVRVVGVVGVPYGDQVTEGGAAVVVEGGLFGQRAEGQQPFDEGD